MTEERFTDEQKAWAVKKALDYQEQHGTVTMRDGENKVTDNPITRGIRPPKKKKTTRPGIDWGGYESGPLQSSGFIAPTPGPFDNPGSWDGRCDGARPTMPLPPLLPDEPLIPGTFDPNPMEQPKLYEEDGVTEVKADEVLGEGQDGGGLRLNAGKLRVDLLPPEWLWALADVMTQGAKKYEPRNWELGMGWSSMIGCIFRHVLKFMAGERYDGPGYDKAKGTTGCHHLAMAAWNCLALMTYDLRKIGKNDMADAIDMDLLNAVNAATAKVKEGLKDEL